MERHLRTVTTMVWVILGLVAFSKTSWAAASAHSGAGISIVKLVNGERATSPPGPVLNVGSTVTWSFIVTNTGTTRLIDIGVTDDRVGDIDCPRTRLFSGQSMTCTETGTVIAGQYRNVATVQAVFAKGKEVSDTDAAHYFGEQGDGGDQGCTPGYWKNHPESWAATPYTTGQSIASVFANAATWPAIANATLLAALDFPGGPGVEGGARILMRAAVAALLNASHPGVDYPRTAAQVISSVNAALASGNRETMLALAEALDDDNNLGCPLN
ncbi:MAG: hypothetical protein NDI61_01330 [Bdellovibrionaceae bacterium]|nr:hypothetical protein [Pseudobdellovibrionaceae bacterium]